ncbi:N-acetylmuramic acid 6-phosphate etherase [Dactylosporangium sp. AC04546]|uniref:N-acetylmuramic acid 6-phosphate etherase n=1 Tax=Dactylosporangium sp. AC04546 TaxID=2862460 RepID=UPI0027E01899|nr:N-acetylmuramic acid 6-phosphate etherase [Dactylosporangium sp. AC04546]WVK78387.1 N-acetylmuramic acid 6-phosphate etherase [Dactylosporangium sp. AC04546]
MTIAPTEARNPNTLEIDRLPTLEILRLVNAEDATVAPAVAAVLPDLARAVDVAVEALQTGHRLHYFGAGSSGRMAVLDASELRPTYGVAAGVVVAHLAGGERALVDAVEAAEDDEDAGGAAAGDLTAGDVAFGVTASGGTPFVAGALRAARLRGAHTVLLSANPSAPVAAHADIHLAVDTGPEVVTGSTRMKAGTAQKLVLNALSTAVMVRLGRTYSNLMTDMVATNAKLRVRQVRMLVQATGAPAEACQAALSAAGGEAKVALLTLLSPADVEQARKALRAAGGVVHRALREVS